MKTSVSLATLLSAVLVSAGAQAAVTYNVKISNSSQMPVSPGLIYAKTGQTAAVVAGQTATSGFIRLCQTGQPDVRAMELGNDMSVSKVVATQQPVMPGESRTFEVVVADPSAQSLHFEAMYGKTKDVCAVVDVGSHSLVALKQHVTSSVLVADQALNSGAFADPAVPGQSYLDPSVCMADSAVGCLRDLAQADMGRVRAFGGYLPSVLMAIEMKYGAKETQSLLFNPGAVKVEVSLKH